MTGLSERLKAFINFINIYKSEKFEWNILRNTIEQFVVYVDLLVLMNLDEDLNLLHCTFLAFPFHHAPPTRQMFVRLGPSCEEHSISAMFHCCSDSSLVDGWMKGNNSNGNCLFCHFALASSFLVSAFSLFVFWKKQKGKSNFSTCFVSSMLLTLSHFSFLFRYNRIELSLKRHFASRLFVIKHSVLQIAKKTTWRSLKRFFSILLINCITTATTTIRNETELLDAGLEERSGDEALVTDRHHPLGSAEWISWQTKHIQLMNNLFLTNYYYQTLLPPWRSSPPPPPPPPTDRNRRWINILCHFAFSFYN